MDGGSDEERGERGRLREEGGGGVGVMGGQREIKRASNPAERETEFIRKCPVDFRRRQNSHPLN